MVVRYDDLSVGGHVGSKWWPWVHLSLFLPLSELKKDDEEYEEEHSGLAKRPASLPAPSGGGLDSSHPYYDVARHGILKVIGQPGTPEHTPSMDEACLVVQGRRADWSSRI